MRRLWLILFLTSVSAFAIGQENNYATFSIEDTLSINEIDSTLEKENLSLVPDFEEASLGLLYQEPPRRKKNTIFRRIGRVFTKIFKDFNDIDTMYIEPQHYNYTVMIQNTNANEVYTLKSKSGQSITFNPLPSVKIGPYIGWRWIFVGYTFDVAHNSSGSKTEFDVSLYSSLFNIDLYYRKVEGFRFGEVYLGDDMNRKLLKGIPFSGLEVDMKGFDLYYIFNHRKFSYPAAFSQSTNQRRSAGSAIVGFGFMSNRIDVNADLLKETVDEYMLINNLEQRLDSGMMFNKIRYVSYQISGGYAYNWVFAKNWLASASLTLAIAYKRSTGDLKYQSGFSLRDFTFGDINFDGVGRFGLVWNNTKYYAGASAILHSYNYRKSQFSVNNFIWDLNIYLGINIGRKK